MNDTRSLVDLNQALDPRAGATRQQSELALQKLLSTIGGN
jgi:hypothetical protein